MTGTEAISFDNIHDSVNLKYLFRNSPPSLSLSRSRSAHLVETNVSSSEALFIDQQRRWQSIPMCAQVRARAYTILHGCTPKQASQKQKRKRVFHDHDTHLLALVLVLSVSLTCSQCNPSLCSGIALSILSLSGHKSYRHIIYRSI